METYIGVITKILDKDLYQVEVDIPERNKGLKAFPLRGEVDEPRVGDVVFLRELDPLYHSYYLYEKLKENNFIGIRARGKKIKITKKEIQIGVFNDNDDWHDSTDPEDTGSMDDMSPRPFAFISIDDKGNIKLKGSSLTVEIEGDIKFTKGTLHLGTARAIPSADGGPFWAGPPSLPPAGTPGISGSDLTFG